MQPEVIQRLLELNNTFYQTFGKAFAITRQNIQPGVARCLNELPPSGDWLDLGSGSGSTARAWAETPRRTGTYLGVDISQSLLDEAQEAVKNISPHQDEVTVRFCLADLATLEWLNCLEKKRYDIISAFAVLHHIPGVELRRQIIDQVYTHLQNQGKFVFSVWQFQHSPRLMARRQPWKSIGLSPEQVDEGDVLLDWRFSLPGQDEKIGLRYVHLYNRAELNSLAESAGFRIRQTFESDGEGNRLGLYQIWQKFTPIHPRKTNIV